MDTISGHATDWRFDANDWVLTLAITGDRLFAGGRFTTVAGISRPHLASLDLDTGTLTPWNPGTDGDVAALVHADSLLSVAGSFRKLAEVNGGPWEQSIPQ